MALPSFARWSVTGLFGSSTRNICPVVLPQRAARIGTSFISTAWLVAIAWVYSTNLLFTLSQKVSLTRSTPSPQQKVEKVSMGAMFSIPRRASRSSASVILRACSNPGT